MSRLMLSTAACLWIAAAASAQPAGVPEVRLARASTTLGHDFMQLRAVRELPDGRLLLTDRLEPALYVADLTTGRLTMVGRAGAGPAEYRLPGHLVSLPGDSTLLTDEGTGRLLVIGPDLRIHRSISNERPGMVYGLWPRAADREGRLYFQIPAWAAGPDAPPAGSVWVARLDLPSGKLDSLVRVKGTTNPPGKIRYGLPYIPFAPQDVWQVAPSGRIALVRSTDYHVEWRETDGRLIRGPRVPLGNNLPVTRADRLAYSRQFLENSGVGGRGGSGGPPTGIVAPPAEMLTPDRIAEFTDRNTFASRKPPFTDFTPRLAPDGTLWVERSVEAGAPRTFDLFDSAGNRKLTVILPPARRLVAVGKSALYLVATREDGAERLELHPIP